MTAGEHPPGLPVSELFATIIAADGLDDHDWPEPQPEMTPEREAAAAEWVTGLQASVHSAGFGSVAEYLELVDPVGGEARNTIIVGIDTYRASVPAEIPWVCRPLTYLGGVSLIAGPPKAGKSTLAAQLQRCRETGERLFGAWEVTTGPTLLVTEEGGVAVVHKTEGLHALDVLDRRSAVRAELTFRQMLGVVSEWGATHPGGLVFIDTLAIWAGIADENDAGQATRAIAAVTATAQAADLAIVLVHHARKAAGSDGEAIRGSGAILATVDIGIELSRVAPLRDDRYLDVMGRVIQAERFELAFDRSASAYTLADQSGTRLAAIEADLAGIPPDGPGLTRPELHALWKRDPRARADQLVNVGRMRSEYVKTGRTFAWRYWSIPPAMTPEARHDD
jgi:AAA domain